MNRPPGGFFQPKQAPVEAQLFATNNAPDSAHMNALVEWVIRGGGYAYHDDTYIYLRGLREAEHLVSVGDWIIRGINGEFYPCRSDIFEATYTPVEEGVPA